MGTKHTPGPWLSKGNQVYCGHLRICSPVYAADNDLNLGDSIKRGVANATLIAAAPELLKSLEEVTQCLSDIANAKEGDRWGWDWEKVIQDALDTIKKAKGDTTP